MKKINILAVILSAWFILGTISSVHAFSFVDRTVTGTSPGIAKKNQPDLVEEANKAVCCMRLDVYTDALESGSEDEIDEADRALRIACDVVAKFIIPLETLKLLCL